MEQPQLAQILASIPPQNQSLLYQKIANDTHLADIAKSLKNWKSVCDKLGITEQEEEEIEADNSRLESQKLALLRKWRSKYGLRATYGKLAECFYNADRLEMVEAICKVLQANTSMPLPAAMQPYLAYSSTQTQPPQQQFMQSPQQQFMQPNPSLTGAGYAQPQSQYPHLTNQFPAGTAYQSAYPQQPHTGYTPQPSQYASRQATQLTPDDLGVLKRLIQPVAGHWIALADQLGMTSLVPTIQSTPQNVGPAAFLRDLLNRWLNKGRPTLETLCKALREDDEIIGGAGVANKLEETFRDKRGGVAQNEPPQQQFMASATNQGYAQVTSYQPYQPTARQYHPPPGGSSHHVYTGVPPSQYAGPPPSQYTGPPPSQYAGPGAQAPGPSYQADPETSGVIRRGDRPTMRNLKKFPNKSGQDINIPLQIGTNYRTFGTFLLEDDSGTIVSGIEMAMRWDAERINEAILMKWIGGKGQQPLTWDTLVTCLRDSELQTLASDIEKVLQ